MVGHAPPQLVGVGDGVGDGVGVGVGAQPLVVQASQQLVAAPTHAAPPRGARQRLALRLMRHEVVPLKLVRQHET